MRRFNDFLKILLAIVVSQFVRESEEIRANLTTLFCGQGVWVAEWTPFLLAFISVRNAHASVQYDEATGDGGFQPSYERKLGGRIFSFIVHFLAFIVAPFAAEHLLAHHTASTWLRVAILGPFLLYLIWDIVIWLTTEDGQSGKEAELQLVIANWLWVDALTLFTGLIFLFFWLDFRFRKVDVPLHYYFAIFIIAGLITVVFDYILNRQFYFSLPKPGQGSQGRAGTT